MRVYNRLNLFVPLQEDLWDVPTRFFGSQRLPANKVLPLAYQDAQCGNDSSWCKYRDGH